jgi:aerobic carbon-monoxide dehydrogenase medium subunit
MEEPVLKSAAFDYVKPDSRWPSFSSCFKPTGMTPAFLAGGQTLLATLNMRLSEPVLVIDITGLQELRGIRVKAIASTLAR